jgi:hypothetical protein
MPVEAVCHSEVEYRHQQGKLFPEAPGYGIIQVDYHKKAKDEKNDREDCNH